MSQTNVTRDRRTERLALAAAGLTVLLWASAFVGIRGAAPHFSAGALALGRLLVGAAALGLILLVRREGWPARAAWPGIVASGVLWFGLYMVALNWGEETVDAGTASMIIGIGPIVIALLSGWLLKEGFPAHLLAGLGIAFAGAAVVGLSMSDGGRASVFGVLLCVVAALAYAVGVVCEKPALRHASALQVTTFGCLVGAVACLPFAGRLVTELAQAPALAMLNMVYLGIFPTALAFTTWAYALARTPAGKLGALTYAVPVLVILMSWAVLREVPGWLTFAGGLLCVVGLAVSRGRSKPRTPSASEDAPAGAGVTDPPAAVAPGGSEAAQPEPARSEAVSALAPTDRR
ncbi:MAG TPA: DMT family transporter [Micromonosporaceae bacterium]|nr:DMT family transporter [Micromonosporaceae bacterium]